MGLLELMREGWVLWIPDSNTKPLKKLLSEPLDAIYIIRRQVERESLEGEAP